MYKILEWVIELLDDHLYEIGQGLRFLARAALYILWSPFLIAARITLFFARDLVVIFWPHTYDEKDERLAIIFWLVCAPALLFVGWNTSGLILGLQPQPAFREVAISIAYLTSPLTLFSYYYLYFRHPPGHHNWPIFIAREEEMVFSFRLGMLERQTRFRLWWAAIISSVTGDG